MAKYAMSDIHGCYDEFMQMLKLIDFKESDELYIIGDVINRGPEPLKILDEIMGSINMHMLLGNHEQMFISYFEDKDTTIWYWKGGEITHEKIKERGYEYELKLYNYLKQLPYIKVIDKFILVHAELNYSSNSKLLDIDDFIKSQDIKTCLWSRKCINNEQKYRDYTVISGHTKVQRIRDNSYNSILFRDDVIYIDCGCISKENNGRLSTLRLDDMEEFYVSLRDIGS